MIPSNALAHRRPRRRTQEDAVIKPVPPFANPFVYMEHVEDEGMRMRSQTKKKMEVEVKDEEKASGSKETGKASGSKSKPATANIASGSGSKTKTTTKTTITTIPDKTARKRKASSASVINISSSDEEDGFEITEVRLSARKPRAGSSKRVKKAAGSGVEKVKEAGRGERAVKRRKTVEEEELDELDSGNEPEEDEEDDAEGHVEVAVAARHDIEEGNNDGEPEDAAQAQQGDRDEIPPVAEAHEEALRALAVPARGPDIAEWYDNIPREFWEEIDGAVPGLAAAPGPAGPPEIPAARLFTVDDIPDIIPLVISLIPDVCPDHLQGLIQGQIFQDPLRQISAEDACQEIVAHLFDTDQARYPKAKSNKRKAEDEAGPSVSKKTRLGENDEDAEADETEYLDGGSVNYKSEKARFDERKGWAYNKGATMDLLDLFPLMTQRHVTEMLRFHLGLFVPTYLDLAFQYTLPENQRPWRAMKQPREVDLKKANKSKAKGKRVTKKSLDGAEVFAEEKDFLINMLYEIGDTPSIDAVKVLQPLEDEPDNECQCCFGDDHMVYMVSCRDEHYFCRDCLKRLLETALGDQKAPVHCMHESGCKAEFTERNVKKVLTPRIANSYFALVQRKELEAAGLENLESCPSCEFAIVIDNEHEKLFTCQHPECQIVSCRGCKKPNHIPKSCAEVAAEEEHLDKRHTIEEAMTQALVRKCPKPSCAKPFLKESGCNKITCMSCYTVSCYICRAIVTNGYAHFDRPGHGGNAENPCRLWDPVNAAELYQAEVAQARDEAQGQIINDAAQEGRIIAQPDLEVALPQNNEVFQPAVVPGAYAPPRPVHPVQAPPRAPGHPGVPVAQAPAAAGPAPINPAAVPPAGWRARAAMEEYMRAAGRMFPGINLQPVAAALPGAALAPVPGPLDVAPPLLDPQAAARAAAIGARLLALRQEAMNHAAREGADAGLENAARVAARRMAQDMAWIAARREREAAPGVDPRQVRFAAGPPPVPAAPVAPAPRRRGRARP